MNHTDRDNRRRWDGESRGHYEVWYITGNDAEHRYGWWIRYTLEAPTEDDCYAQLWFAHFDRERPEASFAINRRFPIAEHSSAAEPFSTRIDVAELTSQSARGALAGSGHNVSWDLRWKPGPQTLRQLPAPFYLRDGLGDTTVLTPTPNTDLEGTIVVDGTAIRLSEARFAQTHLWGRKHAQTWAWGHCNSFAGVRNAALEVLSARLKRGPVTTPPLTAATLWVDGDVHRFAGPRALFGASELEPGRYRFDARSGASRIVGTFRCELAQMVQAEYEDPDGTPAYCCNTEIADLEVEISRWRWGRWQVQLALQSHGAAHFEVGRREHDPRIGKAHVTI